ncbi:hypothetical protein QYE76_046233 [Lolium multiflorum]|uniref:DUF4216 domain-containing protein n=1 Tax=Lolium multiflorum TaxID=4521 RepID=A0AAD8TLR6_LOLMU|nr:hypothetical protein QYE76_046233 [Lolium multiflorum]
MVHGDVYGVDWRAEGGGGGWMWLGREKRAGVGRCFEVDTRGGVAGVFDGAFRIFFDDSLRGSLVFFAGCRSRFEEVETPQDAETSEDPEENTKEYYEALFASQKPLHENTEVTQLDAIARLMALKCHRNLCRDGFDELLVIVGSLLPKGHLLPQNFYYSTKLLSDLKMSSQQIHACPKGCMLFREEHADTNYCIKCNSSRYFEVDRNGDGQKRQTTVAKNILRYLPVLPRIQRLFMTEDTAQQMRWAVEGNRYTDKMIHPSDGTAWKNFVKKFPLKAGDPRSVAVAISSDGFNPYGPKYPGKNMNVYLEPLVDDLVRGWEGRGIRTYDASKKEYFDMYVWYHTSLHDLPARALFCGWCTHGKWPCPQCRQAVTFFWLNKGGKYSCFDEARQFLERRHAYRSDVKSFKKGRVVRGPKPIPKTGTEIKAELDALQPSPDGNGFLGYGETHQWTHKPCLWKLPYFEFLELPHNIDARTDKEMKSELRKIARGFDHSVEAFNSYDVNGYRFQTHQYTTSRPNAKTINSGVVCQGDDGLHYYGRVEGIYELNYGFHKGLNPVVFKCHWFDPRRVRRDPEIGLVEVERNSVYKGEDVYILATQAFQVFYLPYACRNPTKRLHGWDVVMTVPSRNRPPPPNKDDYRRVDPTTRSVEFYQEEGLPGHFTIGLPTIDDMVVDDEQEDAGMDGDNAEDEAEDVCAPEDLSLLEAFKAGLTSMQMDHLQVVFPWDSQLPTGGCDVAWRWAHYSLAEDPLGRGTAADMVVAKFWKYFKRAEGKENACDDVLHQLARKRVTGMHYEARIQCVRDWHADRFVHMSKEDARDTLMQPWQYLQNPPQYVGNDDRCFRAMVMWWTCPQYLKKHEEGKAKRAEMRGGSHIQGSIPISLHLQKEEDADPETGSAVWVNPQSETQCTSYVSKFKQKYGEDANPEAEDFDPEVAVLAGEGLKHGRLWFGDGCVDPARVPSLRQIRRGRKSGQPEEEMAAKERPRSTHGTWSGSLEYQQQTMMQQMQAADDAEQGMSG